MIEKESERNERNMLKEVEGKRHIYAENTTYDKIMRLFLVLFTVVPINYYVGPINFPSVCALVIVALFLLKNRSFKVKRLRKNNILFWTFIMIHVIQIVASGSILTAISYFVSYFLVTYICIHYFNSEYRIYKFVDALILVATLLAMVGIIESLSGRYLLQGTLLNAENGVRYGFLRCSTTFGHPIGFGLFQACVALLAFYRLNTVESKRHKNRIIICYALIVVSCFLSVSRLAICLYIAGQVLLALKMGVNKFLKYLLCILLVFSVALALLDVVGIGFLGSLVSDFVVSFQNMFLGSNKVSSSDVVGFGNRLDLYTWVINDVGNKWFLGKGAEAEFSYKMYDWFTKTSIEVQYLNIFFQYGLLGVSSLVISYIGNIIYLSQRNIGKFGVEKNFTLNSVLRLIFILYYICLFGVQETDTLRIYCILIALGITYKNILRSERMEEEKYGPVV